MNRLRLFAHKSLRNFVLYYPVATLSLCFLAPAAHAGTSRDVVVISDCGTELDDQWAVLYTLISPEFNVKGLLSTHAPNLADGVATSAQCLENIAHTVLGLNIPVIAGNPSALTSQSEPVLNEAVQFLLEQSAGHSAQDPLIVISLGAVTDLGSTLLADPSFSSRAQVWMMGFEDWPQGGVEHNIQKDVTAAQILLNSQIPVTAASSVMCKNYLTMTQQQMDRLLAGRTDAPSRWLQTTTDSFMKKTGMTEKTIYDIAVPAALLGYATTQTYPRPTLNSDLSFSQPGASNAPFSWITVLDTAALWNDFVQKLNKFEAQAVSSR